MINLAGNSDADTYIRNELTRCRIGIECTTPYNPEIATSIQGVLGPFTFQRAWRYYVVRGRVPLDIAQMLYEDPVGKTDIRADGNCTAPKPEDVAIWVCSNGKKAITEKGIQDLKACVHDYPEIAETIKDFQVEENKSKCKGYVNNYHIDSEIGLRVFADTIIHHGLHDQVHMLIMDKLETFKELISNLHVSPLPSSHWKILNDRRLELLEKKSLALYEMVELNRLRGIAAQHLARIRSRKYEFVKELERKTDNP